MDFTENIRDIHIGTIIQEKLTEKSMTISEFAARINKERSTIYDILRRKSLDMELLIDVSKALAYDFIHNVYFKPQTSSTISISIKTEEALLKKINLLEEFFCFLKSKE